MVTHFNTNEFFFNYNCVFFPEIALCGDARSSTRLFGSSFPSKKVTLSLMKTHINGLHMIKTPVECFWSWNLKVMDDN